ncbi:hypothetical protein FA09DRAFT_340139 [Tilletiopsis washingtonensis]|uniref:Uncharacterized protein n=1 Tax=Tilletiopsis washingtonensis TaxID=58919 RepID=A0A316Z3L5_9BASI|nr:hypothetical protein FA09DRAFT_340139 [Tilletiopsis washingtonensis]PWN96340.1 hypothetical protein FA09DRAFT_340139 [Tilletiopsis washingtonensis]
MTTPPPRRGTPRPPPGASPWAAPQSLASPTAPRHPPAPPARRDAYFRRVAQPAVYAQGGDVAPAPAPWQRRANVLAAVIGGTACAYLVLLADFGPREHVFSGLRRSLGLPTHKPRAEDPMGLYAASIAPPLGAPTSPPAGSGRDVRRTEKLV